MRSCRPTIGFVLLNLLFWGTPFGAFAAPPRANEPALPGFRVPEGLTVERFADETQLANPVAFCLDERGRVYVAEEYRFNRGTEENRTRPFLLDDDLQLQSVSDRLAMFQKWADRFEGGMAWFSKHSDQVRLLEDRDGDGRADRSTVFADGFNGPLDGLAAGVIARDGNVYFTCIPNLWLLRDEDGDGRADVRKAIHTGFGVNAAFLGHDLHGLVWGPDGKLYFSVGDRGFHVETKEGSVLHGPRTGAVFRCDPDGAHLEVVARGLRNPQELAFDAYGRLFAADNNCDMGDHARLVYILEGADSGWNMAYQTIREPYLTGPWHAERMWHLPHKGQPAWIVPCVARLGAGPSGFAVYPGVGLPERYRDHFFYCNFTGNGGVETFGLRPKGAGFEMIDHGDFLKPLMATDVDFGYDGAVYVSEFGKLEWDGSNKDGRIYTVADPSLRDTAVVRQTANLFRDGFAKRSDDELAVLLRHDDMRVRLRAQFTLAERGKQAVPVFQRVLAGSHRLARLHAVWGLGQIGRAEASAFGRLVEVLGDSDALIRAQAAKALGDGRCTSAAERMIALLKDADAEVRLNAALALGKIGTAAAIEPLVDFIRTNDDADPFLRHAGVVGLLGAGDPEAVQAKAQHPSAAVRRAVLLTQRRRLDPRVAQFLRDSDLSVATEAARAINDLPIDSGTEALAHTLDRASGAEGADREPLLRRAINARFRLGRAEDARAIVGFVTDNRQPLALRDEALAALADWENPPSRDRVNGFWRPLPHRDPAPVRTAIDESFDQLLATTAGRTQARVIELASKLGVQKHGEVILGYLDNSGAEPAVRVAALHFLLGNSGRWRNVALDKALASKDSALRAEARALLARIDAGRAVKSIEYALNDASASTIERQRGFASLAEMKSSEADAVLVQWVKRLEANRVPAEIELDLVEAASLREAPELRRAVEAVRSRNTQGDPLGSFRLCLKGGDAERGRALFVGHRQAQCYRCHKTGTGGGTAGPDLAHLAARNDREYMLQSLIDPDAKIAPGYGTVLLALRDGRIVSGVLKAEVRGVLSVENSQGQVVQIAGDEVEERAAPRSAMPTMKTALTLREIRDLIEFLSTLK